MQIPRSKNSFEEISAERVPESSFWSSIRIECLAALYVLYFYYFKLWVCIHIIDGLRHLSHGMKALKIRLWIQVIFQVDIYPDRSLHRLEP